MASDDLQQYVNSSIDFYELLGIDGTVGVPEIRKAWRRTSLKYHPDKNPDPSAVEKFHLLQVAVELLCSDEYRQQYDTKRAAERSRKRERELYDETRRHLVEDLERRERAARPRKPGDNPEQDAYEQKLERIAADGKRRRLDLEEKRRKQREELDQPRDAAVSAHHQGTSTVPTTTMDSERRDHRRSIIVHLNREGAGAHVDKERLSATFSRFGEIDAIIIGKDKKKRTDGVKRLTAKCYVVFESIVGAHAAALSAEKLENEELWIDEILWANEDNVDTSEPDKGRQSSYPDGDKQSTSSNKLVFGKGVFPTPRPGEAKDEEITMIRLRCAEKARLEKRRSENLQASKLVENMSSFEGLNEQKEQAEVKKQSERTSVYSTVEHKQPVTSKPSFGKKAFSGPPSGEEGVPVLSFGGGVFSAQSAGKAPSGVPAFSGASNMHYTELQRRDAARKLAEQEIRDADAAEDARIADGTKQ